jgi:phage terminase Nu1 subunit (DNA packaging protein)
MAGGGNGDVVATVERISRKLARKQADNQAVVDLIRELQAVPMTYEALEATMIGRTVNGLRKTAPSALARLLADTLYRQWKTLVDE